LDTPSYAYEILKLELWNNHMHGILWDSSVQMCFMWVMMLPEFKVSSIGLNMHILFGVK